jgi:putative membrane protein insertion efficiency factor
MNNRPWYWRWDGVLVAGTLLAIRGYQWLFSRWMPRVCVYEPNCSEYACLALKQYGWTVGLRLARARVRRCQGGEFFGEDYPQPEKGVVATGDK